MKEVKEVKEEISEEKVTKKDFIYWIIFLVAIVILLLVWKWDNEQQLANQISLVGSVSSILLALVAIGYAFFQTQSNSNETKIMLSTLMKVNDEINKLETINKSLKDINKDLVDFQKESSSFQEKMDHNFATLKGSLEDKSWIDQLDFNDDKKNIKDLKEEFKREYGNHISDKLQSAFQIDNEIMAEILSYVGKISLGEQINEDKIIDSLNKKGKKVSKYELFNELERLNERGILSFVVNKDDSEEQVFAIKTSEIKPLKLVK